MVKREGGEKGGKEKEREREGGEREREGGGGGGLRKMRYRKMYCRQREGERYMRDERWKGGREGKRRRGERGKREGEREREGGERGGGGKKDEI